MKGSHLAFILLPLTAIVLYGFPLIYTGLQMHGDDLDIMLETNGQNYKVIQENDTEKKIVTDSGKTFYLHYIKNPTPIWSIFGDYHYHKLTNITEATS